MSLVINGTFNHKYDLSRISAQQQQPITVANLQDLGGNIISLHKNNTANPAWILSGKWKLDQISNSGANNTKINHVRNLNFNASIIMESIDGINAHRHKITDFKLTNMAIQNRNVIINGTATLTSPGGDKILDKDIPNIPIIIKIYNLNTMTVDMENKIAREHFGGSPIYGKVG